jgi:hypothetical protein
LHKRATDARTLGPGNRSWLSTIRCAPRGSGVKTERRHDRELWMIAIGLGHSTAGVQSRPATAGRGLVDGDPGPVGPSPAQECEEREGNIREHTRVSERAFGSAQTQ